MKTPTIVEIKKATEQELPYFFDRETLRFFGQRMSSFKVRKSPGGRVFIFAPIYYNDHLAGYSFREYVSCDLISPCNDDGAPVDDTLARVLQYIEEH